MCFSALDLPGYGNSVGVDCDTYQIDAVAQIVSAQLCSRTILVGWSMGGLIAQYIANTRNPKVLAHIQIASSPKFVQASNWRGIRAEVLTMFTDHIKSDHVGLLKRFLAIQCLGLPQPKEQMKTMFEAICKYPMSSADNLQKSLSLLIETDLRPQVCDNGSDSVPCLRIFGALDSLVSEKSIPHIQALYPHDKIVSIPKASHAPFLSHEKETFTVIDAFIKSLSGQSRI